jgi:hypothetical protein
MRVRAAATTTALLATAMLAIAATPSAAAVERPQDARSSGAHVNTRRAENQRSTLLTDSQLEEVAVRHAHRMASRGEIYHNRNLGDEVDGWEAIGENVGLGPSVGSVDAAFWGSPEHRNNILGGWDRMGIGVVDEGGDIYVVQVFVRSRDGGKSAPANSSSDSGTASSETKPKPKPKPKAKASSSPSSKPSARPVDNAPRRQAAPPTKRSEDGRQVATRADGARRSIRTANAASQPREVVAPSPPVALRVGEAIVGALTDFGLEAAEILKPKTAVPLLA